LNLTLKKLQKRQHGMCWRKTKTVSPKLLIHGLESAQANDEYGFYSQRTHMEAQKNWPIVVRPTVPANSRIAE
jgi:hypothetical protein